MRVRSDAHGGRVEEVAGPPAPARSSVLQRTGTPQHLLEIGTQQQSGKSFKMFRLRLVLTGGRELRAALRSAELSGRAGGRDDSKGCAAPAPFKWSANLDMQYSNDKLCIKT